MTSADRARRFSGRLPYFLGAAVLAALLILVGFAAQRASQSQLDTLRHEAALLELERRVLVNELESERLISRRTLEALRRTPATEPTSAASPSAAVRLLLLRSPTGDRTPRGAIAIAGDVGLLRLDNVIEEGRNEQLELWRVPAPDAGPHAQERLATLPEPTNGAVELTFRAPGTANDQYEIRTTDPTDGGKEVRFTSS